MNAETSDPWDFFVCAHHTNSSPKPAEREWPQIWAEKSRINQQIDCASRVWLKELADVGFGRLEWLNSDLEAVRFSIHSSAATFWIMVEKANFPLEEPSWSSCFQPLFEHFRKYVSTKTNRTSSKLAKLITEFENFTTELDSALLEIKSLSSLEFQLVDEEDLSRLECDETEPNLLIVRLRLKPTFASDFLRWILVLYVDANDVLAYPNRILTEPSRSDLLQQIDPSKWVMDRPLYENLLTLFSYFLYSDGDSDEI